MAIYKVPQDVEAEDKLLGPFSFKQFIFLIVTVMALGIAYGLSKIALPLVIIPLPIAIFFATLALPLRKDQPMEVYLAAVISFILKPKRRMWQPDGIEALIEVIAPKDIDIDLGKGYSQDEVQKRLTYLASLVDSRGWSVRGAANMDSSMRQELYNEAQTVDDQLDANSNRALHINSLLDKTDDKRKQEIINRMHQQPAPQPAPAQTPAMNLSPPYTPMHAVTPTAPDEDVRLVIDPYPTIKQSVITPLGQQPVSTPAPPVPTPQVDNITTPPPEEISVETVSPAIIDLANNHEDLSIETLSREANRIRKKESEEEIVISLR